MFCVCFVWLCIWSFIVVRCVAVVVVLLLFLCVQLCGLCWLCACGAVVALFGCCDDEFLVLIRWCVGLSCFSVGVVDAFRCWLRVLLRCV